MKIFLYSLSFILSGIFCVNSFAKSSANAIDHIVAIVNEDVITQSELNHAVSMLKLQMIQANQSLPPAKQLQDQMLDTLINKKLQLQIAKQVNITITDHDIDKVIKNIAKQNNISVKELYEHVKEEGLSKPDYRNELRDQLMLQKLQQHEVASHITISPSELKRFEKNKTWKHDIKVENEYEIEDILIPLADNASSQDIHHAKIQAINIAHHLKKHHQLTEKDKAGIKSSDLGYKRLSDLPSAFISKVVELQPHEIAGPIQTGNGFHILRLAGVRPLGNNNTVEPTHKQIEQLLYQHKFEEAMQTWVSKLRNQAFIVTHPDS